MSDCDKTQLIPGSIAKTNPEELLALAKQGNATAYGALLQSYIEPKCRRYAFKIGSRELDSRISDVMLRLSKLDLSEIEGLDNLERLSMTITQRCCIDAAREESRRNNGRLKRVELNCDIAAPPQNLTASSEYDEFTKRILETMRKRTKVAKNCDHDEAIIAGVASGETQSEIAAKLKLDINLVSRRLALLREVAESLIARDTAIETRSR